MIHAFFATRSSRFWFGAWSVFTSLSLLGSGAAMATTAEKGKSDDLLSRANQAYASGKRTAAVTLATEAIQAGPTNSRAYFVRARFHEENHDLAKALTDYDQVLKLDPRVTDAWQHRGVVHFKLGHMNESIADFDRVIALAPEQAPHHWQRGIACYYAGRYEEGRKQFESHQTVNPNDVENAAWHFLCVARSVGVEKARTSLIPIKGDARVPMMEVHSLFAGQAKTEDVLKAARADRPSAAQLKRQLFYAHLYLGLYCEATGDAVQAREHILKAVREYRTEDYMGEVARVHMLLRGSKEKSPAADSPLH